ISRPRIFAAKVAAAIGVVSFGMVWGHATGWFVSVWNHQTFSGDQFRPGLALEATALQSAAGAVAVSYGVLLSFFRRFGLVIFALVLFRGAREGPRAEVTYVSHEAANVATKHYRITYPTGLRERALVLVGAADETYEKVAAALGARESAPIVADLTEVSAEHA